jgi:23S rRNA pseudouridine1911/1915/1917 synthase
MRMAGEKAYKLLAQQENISHGQAKNLIDRGLVRAAGRRIAIARAEVPAGTRFSITRPAELKIIFEDDRVLAVDKPAFTDIIEIEKVMPARLLHRLDRDTSGVLLLVKDEEFRLQAIEAFRREEVYKEYAAVADGAITQETLIDLDIATEKGRHAISRVSRQGSRAVTVATPLRIIGNRTLLKVVIKTGRTHQIRVHLAAIGHPVAGDGLYGGSPAPRLMLHCRTIRLFGYEFTASLPDGFSRPGRPA